jgi:hypothetical protein
MLRSVGEILMIKSQSFNRTDFIELLSNEKSRRAQIKDLIAEKYIEPLIAENALGKSYNLVSFETFPLDIQFNIFLIYLTTDYDLTLDIFNELLPENLASVLISLLTLKKPDALKFKFDFVNGASAHSLIKMFHENYSTLIREDLLDIYEELEREWLESFAEAL